MKPAEFHTYFASKFSTVELDNTVLPHPAGGVGERLKPGGLEKLNHRFAIS
jgi:hypothetical protein